MDKYLSFDDNVPYLGFSCVRITHVSHSSYCRKDVQIALKERNECLTKSRVERSGLVNPHSRLHGLHIRNVKRQIKGKGPLEYQTQMCGVNSSPGHMGVVV